MKILVTGGAGYVGSHTCVELLNAGYEVIVADDLSNSSETSLERIEKITGKRVYFYQSDLCHVSNVEEIFEEEEIGAVIHCAGLKYVAESVILPLEYYYNHLASLLILCNVMQKYEVRKLVLCSSGRVYGVAEHFPVTEDSPIGNNVTPYGRAMVMQEEILRDLHTADPRWKILFMRFFNPVAAHPSGLIGESPNGMPNNLMPYISKVAVGDQDCVGVFGDDYPTPDGTCIRDYIHVCDVARGLRMALEHILAMPEDNEGIVDAYNLATGHGHSVFEMIHAFEEVCGHKIPYEIRQRRPGDIPEIYADATKAERELGWKAEKNLTDMCHDAYNWRRKNPKGYGN